MPVLQVFSGQEKQALVNSQEVQEVYVCGCWCVKLYGVWVIQISLFIRQTAGHTVAFVCFCVMYI